jgi:hypothetical protein
MAFGIGDVAQDFLEAEGARQSVERGVAVLVEQIRDDRLHCVSSFVA